MVKKISYPAKSHTSLGSELEGHNIDSSGENLEYLKNPELRDALNFSEDEQSKKLEKFMKSLGSPARFNTGFGKNLGPKGKSVLALSATILAVALVSGCIDVKNPFAEDPIKDAYKQVSPQADSNDVKLASKEINTVLDEKKFEKSEAVKLMKAYDNPSESENVYDVKNVVIDGLKVAEDSRDIEYEAKLLKIYKSTLARYGVNYNIYDEKNALLKTSDAADRNQRSMDEAIGLTETCYAISPYLSPQDAGEAVSVLFDALGNDTGNEGSGGLVMKLYHSKSPNSEFGKILRSAAGNIETSVENNISINETIGLIETCYEIFPGKNPEKVSYIVNSLVEELGGSNFTEGDGEHLMRFYHEMAIESNVPVDLDEIGGATIRTLNDAKQRNKKVYEMIGLLRTAHSYMPYSGLGDISSEVSRALGPRVYAGVDKVLREKAKEKS